MQDYLVNVWDRRRTATPEAATGELLGRSQYLGLVGIFLLKLQCFVEMSLRWNVLERFLMLLMEWPVASWLEYSPGDFNICKRWHLKWDFQIPGENALTTSLAPWGCKVSLLFHCKFQKASVFYWGTILENLNFYTMGNLIPVQLKNAPAYELQVVVKRIQSCLPGK